MIDDALGDEVRVTVIAAGFDGGTPVQRRDTRALGQVSRPLTAPTPKAPRSEPTPVAPGLPDLVTARVPEVPAFLSTEAEPIPLTGSLEVPRVFTDGGAGHEELDVPDFLK